MSMNFPAAHPLSAPVFRMLRREAKRRTQTPAPGMTLPPGFTDPFLAQEKEQLRARLAALDGRACPVCRALGDRPDPLRFDGRRLGCKRGHSYSNPSVAEAEIK